MRQYSGLLWVACYFFVFVCLFVFLPWTKSAFGDNNTQRRKWMASRYQKVHVSVTTNAMNKQEFKIDFIQRNDHLRGVDDSRICLPSHLQTTNFIRSGSKGLFKSLILSLGQVDSFVPGPHEVYIFSFCLLQWIFHHCCLCESGFAQGTTWARN